MNNIVLIGMPGAGKSSVGVVLAKTMGKGFCDTDLVLQERLGTTLQDFINTRGLDAFLKEEETAILSLACQNIVIATGGSVVLSATAMAHLRQMGRVVFLDLPYREVARRIRNINTRGIAMAQGQTLLDVYHARKGLYTAYADLTIGCNRKSLESILEAILRVL